MFPNVLETDAKKVKNRIIEILLYQADIQAILPSHEFEKVSQ